jgi:hypothetical protein
MARGADTSELSYRSTPSPSDWSIEAAELEWRTPAEHPALPPTASLWFSVTDSPNKHEVRLVRTADALTGRESIFVVGMELAAALSLPRGQFGPLFKGLQTTERQKVPMQAAHSGQCTDKRSRKGYANANSAHPSVLFVFVFSSLKLARCAERGRRSSPLAAQSAAAH